MLSEYDSVVKNRLNNSSSDKYTHHNIQNELITTAANIVCETIVDEVSTSKYFSLLCDETRDTAKTEQMSLIVRYLRSTDQMIEIVESFVGLNAAGLRDTIIDALMLAY